ncbi:unnamed protein product [Trifolium pratense]|uniref:Uncharacterized protein n=1 Tax=Trifolium pratense TaxID=57577 RepID=A0ACB0IFR6_TRIPR|nr:unnamed protein product [Trifolium pratense]
MEVVDENEQLIIEGNREHVVVSHVTNDSHLSDPNANESQEPYIGMEFESQENAYSFYAHYAKVIGFGISIKTSRRSKVSREFIDVKYACTSKERFDRLHEKSIEFIDEASLSHESYNFACHTLGEALKHCATINQSLKVDKENVGKNNLGDTSLLDPRSSKTKGAPSRRIKSGRVGCVHETSHQLKSSSLTQAL